MGCPRAAARLSEDYDLQRGTVLMRGLSEIGVEAEVADRQRGDRTRALGTLDIDTLELDRSWYSLQMPFLVL